MPPPLEVEMIELRTELEARRDRHSRTFASHVLCVALGYLIKWAVS